MDEAGDTPSAKVDREPRPLKIETRGVSFYYGPTPALTDVSLAVQESQVTALIGPSGCGKSTFLRLLNRMNDLIPACACEGTVLLDGDRHLRPWRRRGRSAPPRRNGVPAIQPVSQVDLRERRVRAAHARRRATRRRSTRSSRSTLQRAALWEEVKDRLEHLGARALGRPAAAALHRARARRRARGAAHGRARVGARSARDRQDRGAHPRAQGALHDRHRDAQHAAGGAGLRHRRRTSISAGWSSSGPTTQIFTNPRPQETEDYITGRFG